MNKYRINTLVTMSGTFKDLDTGVLGDPGTVTLTVHAPSGTQTVYTYGASDIVKDAVGMYHMDLTVAETGKYVYRWTGTGGLVGSEETFFRVLPSSIT